MNHRILILLVFFACFGFGMRRNAHFIPPPEETNQDSLLGVSVQKYVVSEESFGKKEFFTWTTSPQIEELRKGSPLLSRSRSANGQPSTFEVMLSDSAYAQFPLAQVLRDTSFSKKRFAWSCAWPTVMGWENEKYGDQLLKITLKDSAIVVAFLPQCDVIFRYEDATGKVLDEQFVMKHKNRIAAVYFSPSKKGTRTQSRGTIGRPQRRNTTIYYSEYVICNEKMIASWEYGTDAVKKEMQQEIDWLNDFSQLLREMNWNQKYYYGYSEPCRRNDCQTYATCLYSLVVAFPNDYYFEDPASITKISAVMKNALAAQKAPISR